MTTKQLYEERERRKKFPNVPADYVGDPRNWNGKCPKCLVDIGKCQCPKKDWDAPSAAPVANAPVEHSDSECLRSIDRSLKTIKGIAIWFLVLSILGVIVGFLSVVFSSSH